MSDRARSRRKMYCPRCGKHTVHVCYPLSVVCTSCDKPQPIKRRKG